MGEPADDAVAVAAADSSGLADGLLCVGRRGAGVGVAGTVAAGRSSAAVVERAFFDPLELPESERVRLMSGMSLVGCAAADGVVSLKFDRHRAASASRSSSALSVYCF